MEFDHFTSRPKSFYFKIEFRGPLIIKDMAFMEVSGLAMEPDTKEIDMGGGNQRIAPARQKHGNLVCKRPLHGLFMSELSLWINMSMRGGADTEIIPCDLMVVLLDPNGNPECAWFFKSAYPVKWDIAGFDSKKNDVALESIEFAYDTFIRVM